MQHCQVMSSFFPIRFFKKSTTTVNFEIELANEPVKVYNFQVEGFHTYPIGKTWVQSELQEKYPES